MPATPWQCNWTNPELMGTDFGRARTLEKSISGSLREIRSLQEQQFFPEKRAA
jgi:hypothetical protein